MSDQPRDTQNPGNSNDNAATELLRKLRQKQGNWVEWGIAIAQLQKSGYNPQTIFEETGFEPVQQNQVVVASQVFSSAEKVGISEEVRSHFSKRASDVLYEFRLLTQEERASATELAFAQKIDCDEAKEIARAIKDFSRFRNPPEGFTKHPGDAVAYQAWKYARQYSDLQERSRLIAKGLRFVHSPEARKQIEQLLTDFTVTPKKPAPILPLYRLESASELARILPVVGEMPLKPEDIKAVPIVEEIGAFRMVRIVGEQAWVPLPGWQVVLAAEDPVVILCNSERLPNQTVNSPVEDVLVVCDRSQREWNDSSYFVVDNNGEIDFQWFDSSPELTILGKIVVIVRPKKVLDEDFNKDSWQIDE
ncbi:hypothetical protein NIES4101_59020 [Calothrix sp. NIES-4101]|nr:hypothetical protein NIES4101_59020 [Calothrix sp. NIES-4101]